MFLNPKIFKKLMKEAYKTGLIVARNHVDSIYIAGRYWEAQIKKDYIPKETMGDLISLIGDIPEPGARISASKEGNQFEVGLPLDIRTDPEEEQMEISDLILIGCGGVHQRLLQRSNGNVYAVNNVYVSIVDNGWVDEKRGEYVVDKPYFAKTGFMWLNNVCVFHAYFRGDKMNENTMKNLQGIDISTRFIPEEEKED